MSDLTTFTPVFEESLTDIKADIVENIPEKWRKNPGDFIHDAAIPAAPEVQQLKINQDIILKNSFALFADKPYLDYRVAEAEIYRNAATEAQGILKITAAQGVVLPKDYTLSTVILDEDNNPITATIDAVTSYSTAGTLDVAVTTTGVGSIMNVPAGSEWILSPPIPGVQTITQEADFQYGTDEESNDSVRSRWKAKKQQTRRSGNKQDYVAWALDVDGCGMARCVPLWHGKGTVKVIITNTEKQPASPTLVQEVQTYIDPDQTGEGNGKAPVGAVVTVESAVALDINTTATITLATGATIEQATAKYKDQLADYLATLAFVDNAVVIYKKVEGLLSNSPYVADLSDFTINGGVVNITIQNNELPTVGTVTLS